MDAHVQFVPTTSYAPGTNGVGHTVPDASSDTCCGMPCSASVDLQPLHVRMRQSFGTIGSVPEALAVSEPRPS